MACYVYPSPDLCMWILKNILINKGLYEIGFGESIKKRKLYFMWYDSKIVRREREMLYTVECYCKNVIQGHDIITDKWKLHQQAAIQSYLAPSWDSGDTPKVPPPWIIKPTHGARGVGIQIVNIVSEYDAKLKLSIEAARSLTLDRKDSTVIVCSYIREPLLYKGRKFHLRLYGLLGLIKGEFISGVCPVGRVVTAAAVYNPDDFSPEVADSHLKSTDENLTTHDIDYDLTHAMACVNDTLAICQSFISTYPESENGFEILGFDILLCKDRCYLLEVNTNPAYGAEKFKNDPGWCDFSNKFFNWLDKTYFSKLMIDESLTYT